MWANNMQHSLAAGLLFIIDSLPSGFKRNWSWQWWSNELPGVWTSNHVEGRSRISRVSIIIVSSGMCFYLLMMQFSLSAGISDSFYEIKTLVFHVHCDAENPFHAPCTWIRMRAYFCASARSRGAATCQQRGVASMMISKLKTHTSHEAREDTRKASSLYRFAIEIFPPGSVR